MARAHAGFGERGGIGDGERHIEDAGERLGEQRLADAGGAEEEDVRLVELDVPFTLGARVDALVVVIDRHRERLLRAFLSNHVLVERPLDLLRERDLPVRLPLLNR